ncbi:hypothetical protein GSI_13390 [Ganoderma sinense ZZ0214-1]|uniref:Uncharacterized protein n=1 Tax=Ganoderma sinense ZZ0214-1 TaxID=1077348 RepID=A0A2G8RVG7_9APHY|nr:hypothetical protein GSI_13390 [Ganoderma sinense ZZ0214-1]
MPNYISNDVQSHASATNEGVELFNTLYCMFYGGSVSHGSCPSSYPSPPYVSEGRHSSDPFTDLFVTAAYPGWQYLFQPQIPPSALGAFPTVAVGTEALNINYPSPTSNNLHGPSQSMPPPHDSSIAAASDTPVLVMGTGTRPEVAGHLPPPGSTLPMVPDEIIIPYEKPPLFSCDFGNTGLTLGDALKKDFSRISVDGTKRAFPSHNCAAKLAFWLVFKLGSDFRSRRKQITVVTTRKGVYHQPSKLQGSPSAPRGPRDGARECAMRQRPFPYTLDDIVLRRIDLISKGTLRPRLYVQVRRPPSIRAPSVAVC